MGAYSITAIATGAVEMGGAQEYTRLTVVDNQDNIAYSDGREQH